MMRKKSFILFIGFCLITHSLKAIEVVETTSELSLTPLIKHTQRVKVWDEEENISSWSKKAEFRIAPIIDIQAVGDLKYMKASYETLYGQTVVHWTHVDGRFTLNIQVPVNCQAKVYLPGESNPKMVKAGNYLFTKKF